MGQTMTEQLVSEHVDAEVMIGEEVMTHGDFIVADGRNFGQVSSRADTAAIIGRSGVSAMIAESVARVFNRIAVNVDFPDITCETNRNDEGDTLSVDLLSGVLVNRTTDDELAIDPLAPVLMQLLLAGGLKSQALTHRALELD